MLAKPAIGNAPLNHLNNPFKVHELVEHISSKYFYPFLVLSWPHFLHAENKFREEVQGLRLVTWIIS